MNQSFSISLPEGFHIMALESSFTHKGVWHYLVYVRHTESSQFRGGQSFDDPQPAVDAALAALRKSMETYNQQADRVGISLNLALDLSKLKRKYHENRE